MAVFRGFPWHRLPIFWFCQILGGVVGAAIVYGNYVRAIDIFEGGRHVRTMATAGYFGTVPVCSLHPHKLLFAPWDSWLSLFPPKLPYVTNLECFFSEFTATALLVMGIFALFDQATHGMHLGIVPIGIFILFTGIAVAFGSQTSFAANPARDFGPRVFTAMVGYGRQVFTFRKYVCGQTLYQRVYNSMCVRGIAGTFSTLRSSGASQGGSWVPHYTTFSFMATGLTSSTSWQCFDLVWSSERRKTLIRSEL